MARCHLRYTLKDAAGNAVQGAVANVYLKGTVTPVSDLWTQETGGSNVATLTSNAQGEFEGWLDAAKDLDLLVTDHSHAAFYPGSPSSLLTFSSFTETVSAFPPAAEVARVPSAVASIRFVTIDGHDTNDGLSWGSAKATIQAALDSLPPYSAGSGGGTVFVAGNSPYSGFYGGFTITSGQYVEAIGERMALVLGNVAGPLVSAATGGNGVDPIHNYGGLRRIAVINQSTSSAARAIEINQFSNWVQDEVHAQSAGGYGCRWHGVIVSNTWRGSYGGPGAEAAFFLDGVGAANNVIILDSPTFQDAKSGLRDITGLAHRIINPHCEGLAGGAANHNGALAFDGITGLDVGVVYVEACNCQAVAFFAQQNYCTAVEVGPGFVNDCAGPYAVDVSNLRNGHVKTFALQPGAFAPNCSTVGGGANSLNLEIDHQVPPTSGTGVAVNSIAVFSGKHRTKQDNADHFFCAAVSDLVEEVWIAGDAYPRYRRYANGVTYRGTGASNLEVNGVVQTFGAGSPEGVVTAGVCSKYEDMTNGEWYIKHTGDGTSTGWKLVTHA